MEHHQQRKGELLKRVSWKTGQALLPAHLVAQERSLLAHSRHYSALQGLPLYGVESLSWDKAKLQRGTIDIEKMHIVFPSGEIVDVPNNATIFPYDLSKTGSSAVSLYLHLLESQSEQEDFIEAEGHDEPILFSMQKLKLSTESELSSKSSIKLAELTSDAESSWELKKEYIPPLISVVGNPFFTSITNQIDSYLNHLQKEFELETSTGQKYASRTIETKICLREIVKTKRYIANLKEKYLLHPYFFYENLCQLLDTLSLIHADCGSPPSILYKHDKLEHTFSSLISCIHNHQSSSTEKMHHLKFKKKEDCYLSEELPFSLQDAKEIYLVLQPVDTKIKSEIEGIKLAAYSRLSVVCQFALSGIELLRLESAPFNNNFSKSSYIFSVKKGVEWNSAIKEKRMALSCRGDGISLQPYLYWKNEDT